MLKNSLQFIQATLHCQDKRFTILNPHSLICTFELAKGKATAIID